MNRYLAIVILNLLFLNPAGASPAMELIPQEKYPQAIRMLDTAGASLQSLAIVSMGFERDSTGIRLFAVYFDSIGQPVKQVFSVNPEYHATITGAAASVPTAAPAEKPGTAAGKPHRNQDGRVYFMLMETAKSTYTLPVNFGLSYDIKPNISAGAYLLTFGSSLIGSYFYTNKMDLGWGKVAWMDYGGELGIAYPALLASCINSIVDTGLQNRFPALKVNAWATLFAYPLGIYLASEYPIFCNTQYGNYEIMSYLGRSAFLYGALLPALLPQKTLDRYFLTCFSGLTMGLIPVGNYLGYRFVNGMDYSAGRGFLIETSGIMGALTGWLLPSVFDEEYFSRDNSRYAMTALTLAGHAAGTWFGFQYRKPEEYSFGQGIFTAASAAAGAAAGIGIVFMFDPHDTRPYTAAGIIGGWGGLIGGEALSRTIFEKSGHDKRTSSLTFPIFSELPAAVCAGMLAKKDSNVAVPVTVVRVGF